MKKTKWLSVLVRRRVGEVRRSRDQFRHMAELRDKGIEIANDAVAADTAGHYEEAISKYIKASEYLLTATKYEKNPVTLKTLRGKCLEYTSRAEMLKKGLDDAKGGGGKKAANPFAELFGAASDEEDDDEDDEAGEGGLGGAGGAALATGGAAAGAARAAAVEKAQAREQLAIGGARREVRVT